MRLRILELPSPRQEDYRPLPGTTAPWVIVIDRMTDDEAAKVMPDHTHMRASALELGGAGCLLFGPGLSVDLPGVDDPDLP